MAEKFIPLLDEKEIWDFFQKRKDQLQGVCITGGEPTVQAEIEDFVSRLKKLGYAVKLDTNGSLPEVLEKLIKSGNIDYIAMDIKTTLSKYKSVVNSKPETQSPKQIPNSKNFKTFKNYDLDIVSDFGFPPRLAPGETGRISDLQTRIQKSIKLIMDSGLNYEFRTTVCHPIHSISDFEEIGKLIRGAKRYFIQNFVQSKHVDDSKKYTPFSKPELEKITKIMKKYIKEVKIR